jgi:succinate dehydrogenase hydrophobic anchor subunit
MGTASDGRKPVARPGRAPGRGFSPTAEPFDPMQPSSDTQACIPAPAGEQVCPAPPAFPASLLRVLALSGHGLWMLLGLALALGIYRIGRSEALLPLALGAVFISAGLLAACLRLPGLSEWHGWHPATRSRPTRDALLALAAYLPMLAVGGLVRGDNAFWATRLAGTALVLCSAASLAYTVHRYRMQLSPGALRCSTHLPVSRMVAALYAGGLWMWLCLATQDGAVHPAGTRPWIMVLLVLALLLGLIEGLRWQALAQADKRNTGPRGRTERFVAALFTYAIPSLALLVVDLSDAGVPLVALAAISCLFGRSIEHRAYEGMLARLCRAEGVGRES